MARLIKATAAAEVISENFNIPLADLVDVMADIDWVEPEEPKKGEWIDRIKYEDNIECPFCHVIWNVLDNCTETFNFCPNCGADMRGDKNEQMD